MHARSLAKKQQGGMIVSIPSRALPPSLLGGELRAFFFFRVGDDSSGLEAVQLASKAEGAVLKVI